MIPSIETIVEGLLAGQFTAAQAVSWLHQHAEGSANDERRLYAAMIAQGIVASGYNPDALDAASDDQAIATNAVSITDALLTVLNK